MSEISEGAIGQPEQHSIWDNLPELLSQWHPCQPRQQPLLWDHCTVALNLHTALTHWESQVRYVRNFRTFSFFPITPSPHPLFLFYKRNPSITLRRKNEGKCLFLLRTINLSTATKKKSSAFIHSWRLSIPPLWAKQRLDRKFLTGPRLASVQE